LGYFEGGKHYEISILFSLQWQEELRNSRTPADFRQIATSSDLKARTVDSASVTERPSANRGVPVFPTDLRMSQL